MKTKVVDIQTNLLKAKERIKRAINKRRRFETYMVGDNVVLANINLYNYCPHFFIEDKGALGQPFCVNQKISLGLY